MQEYRDKPTKFVEPTAEEVRFGIGLASIRCARIRYYGFKRTASKCRLIIKPL